MVAERGKIWCRSGGSNSGPTDYELVSEGLRRVTLENHITMLVAKIGLISDGYEMIPFSLHCDALQWVLRSAAYPVLTRASGKQEPDGGAGTFTSGVRRRPEGRAVLENRRDTMKIERVNCRPCRPPRPHGPQCRGLRTTAVPSARRPLPSTAVHCRPPGAGLAGQSRGRVTWRS